MHILLCEWKLRWHMWLENMCFFWHIGSSGPNPGCCVHHHGGSYYLVSVSMLLSHRLIQLYWTRERTQTCSELTLEDWLDDHCKSRHTDTFQHMCLYQRSLTLDCHRNWTKLISSILVPCCTTLEVQEVEPVKLDRGEHCSLAPHSSLWRSLKLCFGRY